MKITRISIDLLMVLIMPFLMAYSLIGENTHEVIGVCMFVVFIVHHFINRKWWTVLFKGKYNAVRILNTIVNLLLALYMVAQPVGGILMSKYVLKEVRITGAAAMIRTVHMAMAYWGFVLLSFHLGMHVRVVASQLKLKKNKAFRVIVTSVFLLISVYGIYAFVKRGIGDYLLMKTMFAFFDLSESRIIFLLDYLAVMILVADLGYYFQGGLIAVNKRKNVRNNNIAL